MTDSNKLLNAIKKSVTGEYPDAKIILYGSRARSTSNKDSDWDLLILINKDKITPEIEESITYQLYDLELEFGEVISPMVYSEDDWTNKFKITPFYHNVMREGKQL